ncbi:MAG: hypothetical protein M1360_00250 [Candidatus Marsarchaeota archaeon]|nr:hypothetical protein [Candidatus Marsarchaeota archaeon]MCL5418356.1 hypothetical protein [Candidatus Marsarchaeota archaeon]
MSIVIGLKCDDGSLVIASDTAMSLRSEASYVSLKAKKIYDEGNYVFAMSGGVWINQKIRNLAKDIFGSKPEFTGEMFEGFLTGIGDILYNDIKRRLSANIESRAEIKNSIVLDILMAYWDSKKGKNFIWVADNSLKGRFVDEKFIVLSYGDLAYMPLKEFEDVEIGIEEGKLIVFKAIKDTLRLSPEFIAEPIDIVAIDKGGNIKRLNEKEIALLESAYQKLRESTRAALLSLVSKDKGTSRS